MDPSPLNPSRPLDPPPPPLFVEQNWRGRLWRSFGALPWWRLWVGGLIVILALALVGLPYQSNQLYQDLGGRNAYPEFRYALGQEILTSVRTGLSKSKLATYLLSDPNSVIRSLDKALADLERERVQATAPSRSREQLQAEIAAEREKIRTLGREMAQSAARLTRPGSGAQDSAGVDQSTTYFEEKSEALRLSADRLQDLTLELRELDETESLSPEAPEAPSAPVPPVAPVAPVSPAAPKSGNAGRNNTSVSIGFGNAPEKDGGGFAITVEVNEDQDKTKSTTKTRTTFGGGGEAQSPAAVVNVDGAGVAATESHGDQFLRGLIDGAGVTVTTATKRQVVLDPITRQLIQTTIQRDFTKLLYSAVAVFAATLFFIALLIARAFAGRATQGEQRAVIAESRERSESYARQVAEARLMVMRAQVEPHFLFNTLAHVQALQEIDPPQASVMLERLIAYLRAAMPTMREQSSTLGRELEVVRAYLDVLKIRMGDRLNYTINAPVELNHLSFPPTMIATLVENAIKHGLEPKREGGHIAIMVRSLGEQVEVLVADNGLGLGGADTGGTGIGLANTRERLRMLYGDSASLTIEPNVPTGVRAILRVANTPPASVASDETAAQAATAMSARIGRSVSHFTITPLLIITLLGGWIGAHRYYVGRPRSAVPLTILGVLSVLSGTAVFILPMLLWVFLDMALLLTREFRDGRGLPILRWNQLDNNAYPNAPLGSVLPTMRAPGVSDHSRAIALALAICFGLVGAHRFYVGRHGTGVLMILTIGGLGVWWLIDVVRVASGEFRDVNEHVVKEWE